MGLNPEMQVGTIPFYDKTLNKLEWTRSRRELPRPYKGGKSTASIIPNDERLDAVTKDQKQDMGACFYT